MTTDADLPALPEPAAWQSPDGSIRPDEGQGEPPFDDWTPLYTRAAIAAAVAEARAVPVAKIVRNEAGQISMQTPAGEPFDMSRFVGCTLSATPAEQPIDMILYCPNCGTQHVDVPEFNGTREDKFPAFGEDPAMSWTNPPHRSHLCHGCGCIWRPADVPTNGVAEIKTSGKSDTWTVNSSEIAAQPAERVALSDEQIDCLRGLDTDRRVRFYEHDFYVLSNFSAFSIVWDGRRFDTSEHLYHYLKFNTTAHDVADAIFGARSAHEAFKLAERNKGARRKDWDAVKVELMRDILRLKVKQHEYVRRKLLATGDRELVEDSWRDDFWGWGPNRDGRNMLGKLWMEVRAELRTAAIDAARSKT